MRRRVALVAAALLIAGSLSGCAGQTSEPPPTSPTGAVARSLSPVTDEIYDCLVDKGWEPILTWEGIEINSDLITKEQLPLYDADYAACVAPIDARTAAMSESEIREVYEAEVASAACLEDLGIRVDEPPSEQAYVDAFFGDRWMAYAVADLTGWEGDAEKWRELNETCPQPSWFLGAE